MSWRCSVAIGNARYAIGREVSAEFFEPGVMQHSEALSSSKRSGLRDLSSTSEVKIL